MPHAAPATRPLEGRVAVVTGGSRGLGREISLAYADAGADVVVVSRKLDACEALAAEISGRTGRRTLPLAIHMGDWDAQERLLDRVIAEFGRLDILVNNAGMSPVYDSLDTVSEALFDKVIDVNLKGPFRLTVLAGTRMAGAGGGSILNISSVASVRPTPADLPYGAAKAGLNVLTQGFARAFGPNVRVNAIVCGPFLTDIARSWDMDVVAEKMRAYPLQRAGDPREIVGAAVYFASDASSYTTGALLTVDGGSTAGR